MPERRPASPSFVARQIGLPAETVRRKVNRMIAMGLITRVPGGLLVVSMPGVMDAHASREYHRILAMLKSVKQVAVAGNLAAQGAACRIGG